MFITFEGVEGAGKTTQIERLAAKLRDRGRHDILVTREPGGSVLGRHLRQLVLHPPPGVTVENRTELLIMMADRAQHVAQTIRPHLGSGGIVLCDRYADSSVAYQGYGRGLDISVIDRLNVFATDGLLPDRTILLDIDPEIGLVRQKERSRIEEEALSFHSRVRAGFLSLAEHFPDRFVTVDAALPPSRVQEAIWECIGPNIALP
jgi:dTMP kinase